MISTPLRAVAAALPLFCAITVVSAQSSSLKPLVYEGCYTSSADMTDLGSYMYQSPGYCQQQCVNQNKPVMGTSGGSNCWCGDLLPASSSKVSDSECSSKCNGYNLDMCKSHPIYAVRLLTDCVTGGGPKSWSVQLTGLNNNVASESSSSDSSSDSNTDSNGSAASSSSSLTSSAVASPTEKGPPSVVTKASTIIVTAPGQTTPQETIITTTQAPSSRGSNKAGIAAGVVVGIVALSALAGGIFFFLRNRKRRAVEEEYRRNVAGDYGAKLPTSSAGSVSDARLEPSVMMQRRQSDGSIADNQDYSRRILKVGILFCGIKIECY